MKSITTYINEKLVLNKNIKPQKYNYFPQTKEELKDILKQLIEERGNDGDFNDIDVSKITDMSNLFFKSDFNGDISKWNVSKVTDMNSMFTMSDFNGDLSKWILNLDCRTDEMFDDCPLKNNQKKWPQNYKPD